MSVHYKGVSSVSLENGLHASFGWSNAQKRCKSGCVYTKFVHDTGLFKRHGKQKRQLLVGYLHLLLTLAATNWVVTLIGHTTSGLYMIPQCLMVLMFWYLQFIPGEGKLLTQNLDVKISSAGHFTLKHRRCSKGMDECTLFCNMWKFVFLKSFIRASPSTHRTTYSNWRSRNICLTSLLEWLWLNIFGQYAKVGKSNNSTM